MIPSAREARSGPLDGKVRRRSSSCWAARTAVASEVDSVRTRRAKGVAKSL